MKNRLLKFNYFFAILLFVGAMLSFQACEDIIREIPETCFDGKMNGTETDVDCGGDCVPCPTCDDGIMNGNETGIDCGGPDCEECPETCDDGILNNGETEVDCGGPNCEPCFVPPTTAIVSYHNFLALDNPMFHTFEEDDTAVGLNPNDPDNDVTTQGATLPMVSFGIPDPADGSRLVGRYNRPEGLISDGFSDFKFVKNATKYDFSTLNQFELSVYTPAGTIGGSVAATAELLFIDRDNPTFWTTWTIVPAILTKTDEWERLTFDASGISGRTDYDQIAIRIGGSNHTEAATFYIKDFAVIEKEVFMSALFNNDQGFNLDLTGEEGNDVTTQGASLPMMSFGVDGPGSDGGFVGRYNRPEGLISDGFSDYKFAVNATKYNFQTGTNYVMEVYTPAGTIGGSVAATAELIFLDRDNPTFWTTWTIIPAILTKTDEWEKLTFDGSSLVGRTDYDQIAIRIGGSNHTEAATFYVRNFNGFVSN